MAEPASRPAKDEYSEARVHVENIGGIDRCSVVLRPGVTILTGRNATNRTSFLTALADILGGSSATLRSDADAGLIELDLDGSVYSKEYSRRQGTLVSQGTQFTDRTELVELFARVLEDNENRRAVERGDDLRDVIMRPVDTDEIERGIRERKRERAQVDERLDEIEQERSRLPRLEDRRQSLRSDIEETNAEIDAIEETVEEYEAAEEETERAEELLDELESRRQSLRRIEQQIDDREEEMDRLESNLEEANEALSGMTVPEDKFERVEAEFEDLRRRKREISEAVESIQRIIEFNEELLSGDAETDPGGDGAPGDVLSALDPESRTITCWTCGSAVEREEIADQLDDLRAVVRDQRSTERELESEIAALEERRRDIERQRDRKREMENQRDRLEQQIDYQTEELAELRERRADLRAELEKIEERVEETEELRESDLVDAYRRLSDLEYERGQAEKELERVTEEIAEIEGMEEERDRLEERREELSDELSELRSRIEDTETTAVEQFNAHMDSILDLLEYDNLSRVWIERIREGGRDEESTFELHIVRRMEGDAVYEDVVDNLSESEREVVGLVVALSGYLVHEVYQVVPFMLLDSLEAIDSERIAALIDYFRDYVPFLLVALLPEDASAIDDSYARIPASDL